jgi:hypothetical protein
MSFDFITRKFAPPEPAKFETEVCERCEGGGWEYYGLGVGDPHFKECTACGNPEGFPSP